MNQLTVAIVIGDGKLAEEVQTTLRDLPVHIVFRQSEVADCLLFADQLSRLQVDVLFLGYTQSWNSFDEIVRQVRSTARPPSIIALNDSSAHETILAAIRSGADDYIYTPVGPSVRKAVERYAKLCGTQSSVDRPTGKVLAFTSAKGGCGCTTIAVHTAVAFLQLTGKRILLADMDTEAGLVAFLTKVKPQYSMLEAARNLDRLDSSYLKALVSNVADSLDVVPAPAPPVELNAGDLDNLRNVVRFLRTEYDWILLDLGRGINRLSTALLPEIDTMLLVATPEIPALQQTSRVAEKLRAAGYPRNRTHFITNRLSNSIRQPVGPMLQFAEKMAGLPVYASVPNGYLEFCETYKQGKLLSGAGHLTKAMEGLARKLVDASQGDETTAAPVPSPAGITQLWGLLART